MREHPPGSNRGDRIDEYIRSVGLDPAVPTAQGRKGYPYCASFVYWCFWQAARNLGVPNPCPRTGRVARLLAVSPTSARRVSPTRGAVFVHLINPQDPGSDGHAGFVHDVLVGTPGAIMTTEANTGPTGDADPLSDRDGDGVRSKMRPLGYANKGFVVLG